MASPLNGYAGRVHSSGAAVLGTLVWYAVPDLRVSVGQLQAVAVKHGLSDPPKPGCASNAFRRATSPQTRRGENRTKRYLVRPVVNTGDELIRHIVVERVNAAGETLEHQALAEFRFDMAAETMTTRFLPPPMSGPGISLDEDTEAKAILAECTANYNDYRNNLTGPEVNRFVGRRLDALKVVTVNPHGHVYFVPQSSAAEVESLAAFVRDLDRYAVPGVEYQPQFWTVPVPNVQEQHGMVLAGFKSSMLSDLAQVSGEIAEMLGGSRDNFTAKRVESKIRAIAEARAKSKTYKAELGVHVSEVDAMIELLDSQAAECMAKAETIAAAG